MIPEIIHETSALDLTAEQLAAAVRSGQMKAREVIEAYLAYTEDLNKRINAFTCLTPGRALAEADRVDAAVAAGQDPGPLAGVPFSVKNLFDLEGLTTVAGASINREHPPAQRDATSVQRLNEAGAICLGATNMGEYAYDFTTTNAHYGATRNPLDETRSAGGSSGGSAASVLAGMCPLSLGTDTNGSMRVPASFCGIWSLKPGYGMLSRAGSFPFVNSLDTIGVFSRTTTDLASAFDAMSGPDARDPVCNSSGRANTRAALDRDLKSLRIGVLGGYFSTGGDALVHAAVARVAEALATDLVIELPRADLARAAAYVITASEGGALHHERLATRAHDFDPATRGRFLAGALMPSVWYQQAQRFRRWYLEQMQLLFREVDVLLAPATPMLAPKLNEKSFRFGDNEIPLGPNIGLFTQPITLIGLPVLSAPVQNSGNLPTAVQLIGPHNSEGLLLQLAYHLELQGTCQSAGLTGP